MSTLQVHQNIMLQVMIQFAFVTLHLISKDERFQHIADMSNKSLCQPENKNQKNEFIVSHIDMKRCKTKTPWLKF